MLSFAELNRTWQATLRQHALTPLKATDGKEFRAIGDKSLNFLDDLWKARKVPLPDVGAMIVAGKSVSLWADPHFSHGNIIEMCDRPFENVDEMDRAIWENVVTEFGLSEFLMCLGDLSMRNPLMWQRRLHTEFPGRQITVVGNHDVKGAVASQWAASGAASSLAFSLPLELLKSWMDEDWGDLSAAVDWKSLPRRINFGCSHWPVPPDRMPGPGWVCLHGHIHRRQSGPLRVNCSVEAIGYKPGTLRELLTPDLFGDLARRQLGLDGLIDVADRMPGGQEM